MEVAIIGGGAAGMTAASRIRALKPAWKVMVFEATNFVSHAPCGIPYVVEGISGSSKNLMYYPPEFFREKRGIDLHMNAKVVEVGEGYVRVDEEGRETKYEWDKLVIATGALPKIPPIEGIDLKNVFTVRHPSQADEITKAVLDAKNVVIVGAGYVGVEMAEAVAERGKNVTIIEFLDQPLPNLDRDVADVVRSKIEEKERVTLRLQENVEAFEGDERVKKVVTDKGEYPAEVVIVATGVKPNTEIAEQIGCKIGETGAIWTDSRMQTSVENVYAAGDCAETIHMLTKKRVWIPLAPPGNKMGYVAGVNVAGGNIEFPGVLGTQLTKFFDFEIGATGLTERSAVKEGLDVKTAMINAKTRVHYYPGAKETWIKVVAEKETNRILGAQVLGADVAMRVNIFAAMIQAGFTTKDVFFSDLGYAPPMTPIWDPIIVAARVLKF